MKDLLPLLAVIVAVYGAVGLAVWLERILLPFDPEDTEDD